MSELYSIPLACKEGVYSVFDFQQDTIGEDAVTFDYDLCLGIAFNPAKSHTQKPNVSQIAAQIVNDAASNSSILNRCRCHKKTDESSFFIRVCHNKIHYSNQFFPFVVPHIILVAYFFIWRQGVHIIKNTLLCHKWRAVLVIHPLFAAQ